MQRHRAIRPTGPPLNRWLAEPKYVEPWNALGLRSQKMEKCGKGEGFAQASVGRGGGARDGRLNGSLEGTKK